MSRKELERLYKIEKHNIKEAYKSNKREIKKYHKERMAELCDEDISPKDPPKRSLLEEIGNAVTHGVGSAFSIVAFLLMLLHSESAYEITSAIIYFVGLFMLFTMSCLYHSFRHGSAVKRLFRRFDYSSIYLLIGATFAPSLLCVCEKPFGFIFFIIQWTVIALGITLVGVFGPTRLRFIHIPLYLILGWSALMLLPSLYSYASGLMLSILLGGVIYTLGIIPFLMKSRVSHFIWHFFVLAGAVVQWIGIYIFIYLK